MAENQRDALCHLDFMKHIVGKKLRNGLLKRKEKLSHGCNVSLAQEQTMMFLSESMHRYGYKASPAQRRALSHLLHGDNVILHPTPNFVSGKRKRVKGGVLEGSSRENPVTLQTLVKPRVMPGGECIRVNVEGTYVLGRWATCSLGVLCQLDLDDPVIKCQCLILRCNRGTYCELAGKYLELTEDMRALASPRTVQVKESALLHDSAAHVSISGFSYLYDILERGEDFDFGDIKMIVFDWACEVNTHYCAGKVKMIKRICENLNKLHKKFQIAIFSENTIPEPACGELLKLLDANSKLNNVDFEAPLKCTFLECETLYWRNTLQGIEKHVFVELKPEEVINREEEKLKLEKIMDIVKDTRQLCDENRIIIFINRPVGLCDLIKMLEGGGIGYVVGRDGMTQKDRKELAKRFLSVNLMVTNDRWHRDMPLCYFDAHVHSIIHYDSIEDIDIEYYVKRVRWFWKVDSVITLANQMDCVKLLFLQESLGIVFERKGSGKIGGKEFAEQKHYLFPVDAEGSTLKDELSCFQAVVELTALKRSHIVFFVSNNSVDEVVSALKETFGNIPELVITTNISVLEIGKPCLFVSTDEPIKEETGPTLLNEFKKNVHVVISIDKPMKLEDYHRRCGWSKSVGVVIHFGDEDYEDFFELCDDVQVGLGVRLERYWQACVCCYLTDTYYPAEVSE